MTSKQTSYIDCVEVISQTNRPLLIGVKEKALHTLDTLVTVYDFIEDLHVIIGYSAIFLSARLLDTKIEIILMCMEGFWTFQLEDVSTRARTGCSPDFEDLYPVTGEALKRLFLKHINLLILKTALRTS